MLEVIAALHTTQETLPALHSEITANLIGQSIQRQGHGLLAGDRMKDNDLTVMNSISDGNAVLAYLMFVHGFNPLIGGQGDCGLLAYEQTGNSS